MAQIPKLDSAAERFTGLCRLPGAVEIAVGAAPAREVEFARAMREALAGRAGRGVERDENQGKK